jgi:hypothetical protein
LFHLQQQRTHASGVLGVLADFRIELAQTRNLLPWLAGQFRVALFHELFLVGAANSVNVYLKNHPKDVRQLPIFRFSFGDLVVVLFVPRIELLFAGRFHFVHFLRLFAVCRKKEFIAQKLFPRTFFLQSLCLFGTPFPNCFRFDSWNLMC